MGSRYLDAAGLARHDAILDAWAAGEKLKNIAADLGMLIGTVGTLIARRRAAGDPRAVRRWAGEAQTARQKRQARHSRRWRAKRKGEVLQDPAAPSLSSTSGALHAPNRDGERNACLGPAVTE